MSAEKIKVQHDTLSDDAIRKYSIIMAVYTKNNPTMSDIAHATGIPESTIKRQLAQLRKDLSMDIRFIEDGQTVGRSGYYHILNWGIVNQSEFLLRHSAILEER